MYHFFKNRILSAPAPAVHPKIRRNSPHGELCRTSEVIKPYYALDLTNDNTQEKYEQMTNER